MPFKNLQKQAVTSLSLFRKFDEKSRQNEKMDCKKLGIGTYSALGIGYSGYLVDRNSAILSIVTSRGEQMYLPFRLVCSRMKICALATSSV